jgi:hypothetical protein
VTREARVASIPEADDKRVGVAEMALRTRIKMRIAHPSEMEKPCPTIPKRAANSTIDADLIAEARDFDICISHAADGDR